MQKDSPLFSRLPPEVRSKIFAYTVAEYEDVNNPYPINDTWKPSYSAPRKICLELLATCRAVYLEAWFLPFKTIEQSIWLTRAHFRPILWAQAMQKLNKLLSIIERQLGQSRVEIGSLHVYATVEAVEKGMLLKVLQTPGLHPRQLVLTISHEDWPDWNWDAPLRFEAGWIKGIFGVISSSTQAFIIELEVVEQRKNQVDVIAKHIAEHWFFRRSDGNVLYADASAKCLQVSQWTGPSSWRNERWAVDSNGVKQVKYHTLTVAYELELSVKAKGGMVSEAAMKNSADPSYEHLSVRVEDTINSLD
ncbi:uncharacterized protein TRIREDRAFT_71071 [Trichoderma reesei QM6a]|uniref:Predicted protein n=2 Tax=Hypocrea jecorina TaxID=51453 RepID=G0RXK7_HYPJQ|nr:uncharacterized protein TRIREDRAFT_71071 [Trichoderma reesei QM6a]EGR44086.1 predicted protein [Trichoderma reesei QM6a]ETR96736.1 hypothetical protein M419DRAFT_93425 [Trichoderma reesei RUT C-30]